MSPRAGLAGDSSPGHTARGCWWLNPGLAGNLPPIHPPHCPRCSKGTVALASVSRKTEVSSASCLVSGHQPGGSSQASEMHCGQRKPESPGWLYFVLSVA